VAGGHHRGADQARSAAAGPGHPAGKGVPRGDAHVALLPLGQAHLLDGVQHVVVGHVDLLAVVGGQALQVAPFALLQGEKIVQLP